MFHTLITHRFFDQSERAQGPIYIIKLSRLFQIEDAFIDWTLCFEQSFKRVPVLKWLSFP